MWQKEVLLGKIRIVILKVKSCEASVRLGKYTQRPVNKSSFKAMPNNLFVFLDNKIPLKVHELGVVFWVALLF